MIEGRRGGGVLYPSRGWRQTTTAMINIHGDVAPFNDMRVVSEHAQLRLPTQQYGYNAPMWNEFHKSRSQSEQSNHNATTTPNA